MRAWNKPDDTRERYLGEIAPLLEAARQVDSFAPVQKRRLRRRIVRTLFGTRRRGLQALIAPVLAALALLALGGAAFATAQRLGLLPRLGHEEARAPAGEGATETHKRKPTRARKASPPAAVKPAPTAMAELAAEAVAEPAVKLPTVPDPLLFPVVAASTSVWAPLVSPEPVAVPTPVAHATVPAAAPVALPRPATRVAALTARKMTPSPIRQIAMVSAQPGLRASAPPAPNPSFAPALAYPAPHADLARTSTAAPSPLTAAAPVVAAPSSAGRAVAWATPAPAAPVAVPSVAPMADPPVRLPAVAPHPAAAPPAPVAAPAAKPALSDQAMFGQAMRKLRAENDLAGALAILRDHGKAYPKSPFAGERNTLEVEALLGLHRDREALALLDGMALDGLPRSGERFVVRGELRASARRWLEANQDFEHALIRVSGSPAWHERALWGRAVSRLRLGERESGMADIERYLDTYPKGRFAADAAKFFPSR